jgi:hypothetical protein
MRLAACALLLIACSSTPESPPLETSPPPEVTFHRDVAPILQKSCQSCHVEGGVAPFPLVTYEHARNMAESVVRMTAERKMPPWGAEETSECKPPHKWKDDPRLSDAEIATLAKWKAIGTPEGDPKEAPAPLPRKTIGLPRVDLELQPQAPYTLTATSDQFRCFVLDPKVTTTTYVNGVAFVPGNSRIVHHVLLFSDPQKTSLAMAGPGGAYDCFGGARTTGGSLLAAWAPGGQAMQLPANAGTPIEPGTLLVMQIHYHPHGGAADPDITKVQLAFTGPPEYIAATRLIGNFSRPLGEDGLLPGPADTAGPEFRIPANASGHTETMRVTMPAQIPELRLYGIGGHMHYVGVDERLSVTRADGAEQCLLQIPRWDFNWQRGYAYDAPIEELPVIKAGDKLGIRCTYDNTTQNPKLVQALREQNLTAPKDVLLGEETLDEMCLGAYVLLYKR